MDFLLVAKITSSPSLPWVVAASGFHLLNVFLGAFMAFRKTGQAPLRVHKLLYYSILICLGLFLLLNQTHSTNSVWEYAVCLYFITIIPLSKSWDVLLHAFVSLVGLTLLPLLIILQFY